MSCRFESISRGKHSWVCSKTLMRQLLKLYYAEPVSVIPVCPDAAENSILAFLALRAGSGTVQSFGQPKS